jgi:hypothetical protein
MDVESLGVSASVVRVKAPERDSRGSQQLSTGRLWLVAAGLAAGNAVAIGGFGWRMDWRAVGIAAGAVALLVALGFAYRTRDPRLARLGQAMALAIAFTVLPQLTTYSLGTLRLPLRSDILTAADHALGFDWTRWVAWVRAHPIRSSVLRLVYPWHIAAGWVTVGALAIRGPGLAERFLRAFLLAFGVAALCLVLWPALTNTPGAASNAIRLALRDGTFTAFDYEAIQGLISFPSMHVATAVLVARAWWTSPRLRWPTAIFAALIVLGAPSEGGHYLVDVIAGGIVADWSWRVTA